jgi:hypothetical protein
MIAFEQNALRSEICSNEISWLRKLERPIFLEFSACTDKNDVILILQYFLYSI